MKTEIMFKNIKAFVFDVDGVFTDGFWRCRMEIYFVHLTQKIVLQSEWRLTMVIR